MPITSGSMITSLKDEGIWFRGVSREKTDRKTTQRQNETVYYQRYFVLKWIKSKWVIKDDLLYKYILAEEELTIRTFYTD